MDAATTAPSRSQLIRSINDRCRHHFVGCTVMATPGVTELQPEQRRALLKAVREFDQFDSGNDPHEEHDFGSIIMFGQNWFWKFDYYDETLRMGSDDPSNAERTRRVLTIMCASEY